MVKKARSGLKMGEKGNMSCWCGAMNRVECGAIKAPFERRGRVGNRCAVRRWGAEAGDWGGAGG